MIRYVDAKHLKHSGKEIDVKVSILRFGLDSDTLIHIRDQEFTTFEPALRCLRRISEEEMPRSPDAELEVLA